MSAENSKNPAPGESKNRTHVSPWRVAVDIAFTSYILWSAFGAAKTGNITMSIIYFIGVVALAVESIIRYRRKDHG